MEVSKNIKQIINILLGICLFTILLLISDASLIVFAFCPILLAIVYFSYGLGKYLLTIAFSLMLAFIFADFRFMALNILPLFIISLIFLLIIKSDISDREQIIISWVFISLILIVIYKLSMLVENIDIDKLANDLKKALEEVSDYKIAIDYYKASFALYPAILSSASLIYSLIGLKIIRNFLSYKNIGKDLLSVNTFRLEKKDLLVIFVIAIVIYFLLGFFGVNKLYIRINIIFMIFAIFTFNGMFTFDYILTYRQNLLTKTLQWFFILLFFYLLAIMFFILGIIDVFMDLRKKLGGIYGKI